MTERIAREQRERNAETTFTFTSVRRPGCSAYSIHEFHFHGHGRTMTFPHSLRVARREDPKCLSAEHRPRCSNVKNILLLFRYAKTRDNARLDYRFNDQIIANFYVR